MRVLLSTDTVGGVWTYASTLANALSDEGHAVLLAAIGDPSPDQHATLSPTVELAARPFRLEWMRGGLNDVRITADWLADLAARWGSQLVHLNQMTYPAAVRFAVPTIVVVHSDVCSWFSEVRGSAPPAEWIAYRRAVGAGLAAADTVVAPSRYQATLVERHYGLRDVVVIHNGTQIPARSVQRDRCVEVVTAGRAWDEAKGIDVLDRALDLLTSRPTPAYLLGPPAGPDGGGRPLRNLRAQGRIPQAEVESRFSRSLIYAAPALYEPFGLAVAEAAARGCALVLSDIGSFSELWSGCACFFPAGDAEALASQIDFLLNDPAAAGALGAAAASRASERFSLARSAARYLMLYNELTMADPLAEVPGSLHRGYANG